MNHELTIMNRDGTILYQGPMPLIEWSYRWGSEREPWYLPNARRCRPGNIMRRKLLKIFKRRG